MYRLVFRVMSSDTNIDGSFFDETHRVGACAGTISGSITLINVRI